MNTTQLKSELYNRLSSDFEISKNDVDYFVEEFIDVMQGGLLEDGKVLLRKFGTLKVVTRAPRMYSVKGREVETGPRPTVVFKPGTGMMGVLRD